MVNAQLQPSGNTEEPSGMSALLDKINKTSSRADSLSPIALKLELRKICSQLDALRSTYKENENALKAIDSWTSQLASVPDYRAAKLVLDQVSTGLSDLNAGKEIKVGGQEPTDKTMPEAPTLPIPTDKTLQDKEAKLEAGNEYVDKLIRAYTDLLKNPGEPQNTIRVVSGTDNESEYTQVILDRSSQLGKFRSVMQDLTHQLKPIRDAAEEYAIIYLEHNQTRREFQNKKTLGDLDLAAENIVIAFDKIKFAANSQSFERFQDIVRGKLTPEEQRKLATMTTEEQAAFLQDKGGLLYDANYKDLVPEICDRVYGNRKYLQEIGEMLKDPAFIAAKAEYEKNADYEKNILTQNFDVPAQYAFFTATKAALIAQEIWSPQTVNTILKVSELVDVGGRPAFFTNSVPAMIKFFTRYDDLEQLMLAAATTGNRIADRFSNSLALRNEMLRKYYDSMVHDGLERMANNRGLAIIEQMKANPDERDFSIKTEAERIRDRVKYLGKIAPVDIISPNSFRFGLDKMPESYRDALRVFGLNANYMIQDRYPPGVDPLGTVYSLWTAIDNIKDLSDLEKRFYHTRFGFMDAGAGHWWSGNEVLEGVEKGKQNSSGNIKGYADLLGAYSNMRLNFDSVHDSGNYKLMSLRSSGQNLTLLDLLGSGVNTTTQSYSVEYLRDSTKIASLEQLIATSNLTQGPTGDFKDASSAVNVVAYYRENVDGTYEKDVLVKSGRDWIKINSYGLKEGEEGEIADRVYGRIHYDPSLDGRIKQKKDLNEGFIVAGNLNRYAVGAIRDTADGKNDTAGFISIKDIFKDWDITVKGFEKKRKQTIKEGGETWKPPSQDHRFRDLFDLAYANSNEFDPSGNTAPDINNVNDVNKLRFVGNELTLLTYPDSNIGLFAKWKDQGFITSSQYDQLVEYANQHANDPNGISLRDLWREYELVVLGITEPPGGGTVTEKTVVQNIRSIAFVVANPETEMALGLTLGNNEGADNKNETTEKSLLARRMFGKDYYLETAWYRALMEYVQKNGGIETFEKKTNEGWSTFGKGKTKFSGKDLLAFIVASHIADDQGKATSEVANVKIGNTYVQASEFVQDENATGKKDNLATLALGNQRGRLELAKEKVIVPGATGDILAANSILNLGNYQVIGSAKDTKVNYVTGDQQKGQVRATEIGAGVTRWAEARDWAWTLRSTVFVGPDKEGATFSVGGLDITENQWKWIGLLTGEKNTSKARLEQLSMVNPSMLNQDKIETWRWAAGLYNEIRDNGGFWIVVEQETKRAVVVGHAPTDDELKTLGIRGGATYLAIPEKGGNVYRFTGNFNLSSTEQRVAGELKSDMNHAALKIEFTKNEIMGITIEYGRDAEHINKTWSGYWKFDVFYKF